MQPGEVARELRAQMAREAFHRLACGLAVRTGGDGRHPDRIPLVKHHPERRVARKHPPRRVRAHARDDQRLRVDRDNVLERAVDAPVGGRFARRSPPVHAPPGDVRGERHEVHLRAGRETHRVAERVPVGKRHHDLASGGVCVGCLVCEIRTLVRGAVRHDEVVEVPLPEMQPVAREMARALLAAGRKAHGRSGSLVDQLRLRKPHRLVVVESVKRHAPPVGILLRTERDGVVELAHFRDRAEARRRAVVEARAHRHAVDEDARALRRLPHPHLHADGDGRLAVKCTVRRGHGGNRANQQQTKEHSFHRSNQL